MPSDTLRKRAEDAARDCECVGCDHPRCTAKRADLIESLAREYARERVRACFFAEEDGKGWTLSVSPVVLDTAAWKDFVLRNPDELLDRLVAAVVPEGEKT